MRAWESPRDGDWYIWHGILLRYIITLLVDRVDVIRIHTGL